MLEALKWGEDSGIVLRLYETYGVSACTEVRTSMGGEAIETDILELNNYGSVDLRNLCLKPYEIKTILIRSRG
ncbi:glycosyl hydrolase-related protein [Vulcanisaeta sp. JCM 14467]|uniref:glycosyl hydrolase-related protein n=1 Tax=Vulcanisaeta sp. JCM 14467 TaxID=1295370 RepID=UPI0031837D4E